MEKAMKQYFIILSLAGSDCSGGAGIQADIKTMSALGCYAATVVTALTAQNTVGVQRVMAVPSEMIVAQIRSVMDDLQPRAIKIGMVNDRNSIHAIASTLRDYQLEHVVIDPVMVSTSGERLMMRNALETFVTELLPLATLITPNIPESKLLFPDGISVYQESHPQAVLLKGGHRLCSEKTDILYQPHESPFYYHASKVETMNTHGTGCTLSSAVAAYLAQGLPLAEAVKMAKEYMTSALREGSDVTIGQGHGPVNHLFHPHSLIKL